MGSKIRQYDNRTCELSEANCSIKQLFGVYKVSFSLFTFHFSLTCI